MSTGASARALCLLGAGIALAGCAAHPGGEVPTAPAAELRYRDFTEQAGIRFRHVNGSFGQQWMPETMGSGCAFIDYDNDGRLDLFFVNSAFWPGHRGPGR